MSFFLFTIKFIRSWNLHSNWVRLNLSISCFIMVCLHGKVIVIEASWMFSLLSQLTFIKKFHLTFFLSNTIYYFWSTINPLHPNISMYILHTVLNTLPYVLAGRICLTIKRLFSLLLLHAFILITLMFDSGVILKREIRCWSPSGI